MSWSDVPSPACGDLTHPDVDLVIETRPRDLGDLVVGRVLPSPRRRLVGPFLFFDEMGPVERAPGHQLAVRPHPHINLATVTYLFEGEITHRDSLGTEQVIRPGAVNWMTAGRGIVHSERTPPAAGGERLHGLQLWCGLPAEHEETAPTFEHYPADVLPEVTRDGCTIRVLAGEAFGLVSPVRTLSRLFYVDVLAATATRLEVPSYPERAVYAVAGAVTCGGERYERGRMLVLCPDRPITIELEAGTRLVMLGGDPIGPRFMYWNFVSSRADRLEDAKRDWRDGRFPKVPGDEIESIPLPD